MAELVTVILSSSELGRRGITWSGESRIQLVELLVWRLDVAELRREVGGKW